MSAKHHPIIARVLPTLHPTPWAQSPQPSMRRRAAWAHAIDRALREADASTLLGSRLPPFTHHQVVRAAAPALRAIAAMLRDEHQRVSPAALAELRHFLIEGRSPLLGEDCIKARWVAEQLRQRFIEEAQGLPYYR